MSSERQFPSEARANGTLAEQHLSRRELLKYLGVGAGGAAVLGLSPSLGRYGRSLTQATATTWESLVWGTNGANSPQSLFEAQGLATGGLLYVFGGFYTYQPYLTTVQAHSYNYVTNHWHRLADVPVKLTHAGQAVDSGAIYLAGGFVGNHPGGSTAQVWKYNIAGNTWSAMPSMPADRGGGALVQLNHVLHYFGGGIRQPGGVITQDFGDHWALDLTVSSPTWTTLATMPNPRNHMGGCALNGKIYAIGGQHLYDESTCQSTVNVYDPATDTWSAAKSLPQPRGHITSNVQTHNGHILLVSGITNPSLRMANDTEYDPVTNTWRERTPLPSPRQSPVSGIVGRKLIVSGGSGPSGPPKAQTWRGTLTP